mgnify:CR=1 FL=1
MSPDDVSMRVIADHARAAAFLIADGVQPSNEGRGYVLRRIMRRAIRHGSLMGLDELFFFKVVDRVIELMGDAYSELREGRTPYNVVGDWPVVALAVLAIAAGWALHRRAG